MDLRTAERLTKLRKQKGLSQEELADRLNVSRQAVSKWERAESSPDTDNLIELAKIYGITLDELIFGEDEAGETETETEREERTEGTAEEPEETDEGGEESATYVHIEHREGESTVRVSTSDGDEVIASTTDEEEGRGRWLNLGLYPLSSAIILLTYLALGVFLPDGSGWANYWFLFILIPVIGSIEGVIKHKKISHLNYPCLVVAVFCAVGMLAGVWHPTWVLFLTIPVFYMIFR